MARHEQLTYKRKEYLSKQRGKVTEQYVRNWFAETETYLGPEFVEILRSGDPTRVWNMDETSFYLNNAGTMVIAEKGKAALQVGPNDKENLTVLVSANANGEVAVPFALFAYKRLPSARILDAMPPNWCYGKSDSGWMTSAVFYEFIANFFYPYLKSKNITFPVVVFLDGHKTHLSLPLSIFCEQHEIIIVCLPPNTTHFIQVLDVIFFRPMKLKWNFELVTFRVNNEGYDIRKEDIPRTLQKIFDAWDFAEKLRDGFASCGLYPFNADSLNYGKLITHQVSKKLRIPVCYLPTYFLFGGDHITENLSSFLF